MREVTEELQEDIRHTQNSYLVRSIHDIRAHDDGAVEVDVWWEGFRDVEGTYENEDILANEIPTLIRNFPMLYLCRTGIRNS